MKKINTKMIVENWRKFLNEELESDTTEEIPETPLGVEEPVPGEPAFTEDTPAPNDPDLQDNLTSDSISSAGSVKGN